jgi:hypothetical protein
MLIHTVRERKERMRKSDSRVDESLQNTGEMPSKKYPWTMRRIAALAGIILLIAMYALTMVFALVKSPYSKGLLMGSIFCTIAVPVLLYAMTMVAGLVRGKGIPNASDAKPQHTDSLSGSHTTDTAQSGGSSSRTSGKNAPKDK